jgi:hypothetical protein
MLGSTSIAVDPVVEDVLVLVTGYSSLTAYRVKDGGDVTSQRISGGDVWGGVLCVNPANGQLSVVYAAHSENGTTTIRVRTRT